MRVIESPVESVTLAAMMRDVESWQAVAVRGGGLGRTGGSDAERTGQIPDMF